MRLALLNKDYVRVQIQAQKVNLRTLAKPDFQEQRVRYDMVVMMTLYPYYLDGSMCVYLYLDTMS